MTNGSLAATTATTSAPLALNWSRFFTKPGRCSWWHVGVNAPGTEKRTTFLFAQSLVLSGAGRPHADCAGKVRSGGEEREGRKYVVRELGRVRHGHEGRLRERVADLERAQRVTDLVRAHRVEGSKGGDRCVVGGCGGGTTDAMDVPRARGR
jgi:hypothetical protein